ncbi:RNA-directed DNA polymerase, eukaryota, reverse transcriptase zinc-binding domain protein [Tanacetum coccineum]
MGVLKKLESMRQRFFWGGNDECKKIAWVKWDLTLNKANLGGLNIGSLKACNWALLGKWWWRFQVEGDRLWIKIIKSIYGTDGGLSVMLERRSNRLSGSIWGDIMRVGKDIDKMGINFCSSFGKMVGNGYNTRFWLDRWVGEGVLLCENFPRLFRLETNKDESVGEKMVWGEKGWEWQWNWAREPRGRGEGDLMELTALTNFFVPNVLQVDSWRWLLDKNGQFTVKCLREKIDEKILISTNSTKETKWSKIIPRKICIFIWRLQQRRLPVLTWLQHIGMDLNSILCPHCEDDIETFDHCFMRCSRVLDGWKKVFKWWKMDSFNVRSIDDIINHTGRDTFNKKQRSIWQAVCWSMLHLLWHFRNNRIFENKVSNLTTVCDELQVLTFYWVSHRAKGAITSWIDWCSDPVTACKV